MKHHQNIKDLLNLEPDFIGFIFYEKSKRFVGNEIRSATWSRAPNKVGVFVNSPVSYVLSQKDKFNLDFVQLHGNESPDFCESIQKEGVKIIKVFQVNEEFNFSACAEYEKVCDYFLFDTQTPNYGGSGKKFDWKLLKNYKLDKKFFLSGGIKPEDADEILKITDKRLYSIDINSGFEIEPAVKDIEKLKIFFEKIRN